MKRTVIAIIGIDNPGRIFSSLLEQSAEHVISERWLRHGFWKKVGQYGLWLRMLKSRNSKVLSMISVEEAEEDVIHHLGAVYVFPGTFDEFLVQFCKVPMGADIKQCPNQECNQYFTSPPSEFFKHVQACCRKTEQQKTKEASMIDGDHDDCCCSCC